MAPIYLDPERRNLRALSVGLRTSSGSVDDKLGWPPLSVGGSKGDAHRTQKDVLLPSEELGLQLN